MNRLWKLWLFVILLCSTIDANADFECYGFIYKDNLDGTVTLLRPVDVLHGNVNIPNVVHDITSNYKVTGIADAAFSDNKYITSVGIPSSVKWIGIGAFSGCTHLESVTLNGGDIGLGAFQDCSSLKSITLFSPLSAEPQNTTIGDKAFSGCSSLTSIFIPYFVREIGDDAFSNCSGLTSISVSSGNTFYDSREDCNAIIETATNTLIAGCENTIIPNDVTSIDGNAFSGRTGLTSITIPNSVMSIGHEAFMNCSGLTSIMIQNGVREIGNSAFYGCTGLNSLAIPNSMASIGNLAFASCSGLTSINVDSNNTIYDSRNGCNAIIETSTNTLIAGCKNTNIPNDVTNIGDYAFLGCTELASITIPNSVTDIGTLAFYRCTGLYSVTINANSIVSKDYTSDSDNFSVIFGSQVTHYSFGEDVQSIGAYACCRCKDLVSVDISNSIASIGYKAFSECGSLTSVNIPNSVTSIGSYAFWWCKNLTSLTIGNNVKTIGDQSFMCCSGLTNLTIPNSVTSIGSAAFASCAGLTSVTISNSMTSIDESVFNTCTSLTSVNFGDNITSIGDRAFYGCRGLTSLTIPIGMKSIGVAAFKNCTGLASVNIPNTVTSLGDAAFDGCNELTSVTIFVRTPLGITSSTFSNRSKAELYVPTGCLTAYKAADYWKEFKSFEAITDSTIIVFANSKVKTLCTNNWDKNRDGEISTYEATKITTLGTVFKGNTEITSFNELQYFTQLKEIVGSAFEGCNHLASVTIPNSVNTIWGAAFRGCSGLTSITLPNNVSSIVNGAFSGCSGLNSIIVDSNNTAYDSREDCNAIIETATNKLIVGCKNTNIPNSVTSIGESAFSGCTELNTITIPSSVTSIEQYAFNGCSALTSITLPSTVTSIGQYAFGGCSGLTGSFVIPNGVTNINSGTFKDCNGLTSIIIPSSVVSIGLYAFNGCSGLTSITLPNSITSIGERTFKGCSGLTSLTIPNSVTTIGYEAFAGCSGLTSVNIPGRVMSIGQYAFRECGGLKSITIPSSVTSIGNYAFYGCTSLTSVMVDIEMPPTIASGTFSNRANATLYVPIGCREAYMAANYWKDFKEIIEYTFIPKIEFVDATVKSICVANWDSDGDGELTEEEAAAVTDLGEVFKEKTEITSFNELQYFTSLSIITSNTFYGCGGLTSITIPSNVTSIENGTFRYCDALTSIIVDNGNATYDSRNGCNAIIETATNTLIAGCKCTIIPNDVTSIGGNAFYGCTGLTSITIPNSVTSIGNYVFYDCELSSINIPGSVTTINRKIFVGAMVESVVVDGDNTVYDSRNDCNAIIETASNTLIVGCKNTVIPNSVIKIGTEAFAGCKGLINLIIPEGVEVIGGCVFLGSSDLISISIPTSVKQFLRGSWIDNDSHLETVFMYGSTPVTIYETTFVNRANATLYVPAGCKAAYESANYWKQFHEIIEMDPILATNITLDITTLSLTTVGQTETLTATILPGNATDKTIAWTSSNTAVATVDIDGKVTAVADGTTFITAATNDGTNLTATCKVTVVTAVTGDANGDGEVTIADVVAVVNYITTNGNPAGQFIESAADVDGIEGISIADAVAIVNIILNGGLSE